MSGVDVFTGACIVLASAVVIASLILRILTRSPAPAVNAPGSPPALDPLSAGILLNLPRRALGAGVLDLLACGVVARDPVGGPTPLRLVLARPLDPFHDLPREALQQALFGRHAVAGATFDPDPKDREKRSRLAAAASSARFFLHHDGLITGNAGRRTVEIANWVLLPLVAAAAAASVLAGVVVLALAIAAFVLRRGVGAVRTAEGTAIARDLAAFGATLRNPALAAARPAWWYLFHGGRGTPWPAAGPPARSADDAGPATAPVGDALGGKADDWPNELGGAFDIGGAGGGDGGGADGGGDGGGGD